MATTILDLPPELLVRVSSYLTTPELGPFRRSCKQIESYLFESFAKEFFSKRQFMIEHPSLDALLGIANHPGLAAKLTEVIIGTQALDQSWYGANNAPHKERFVDGYLQRHVFIETGLARDMLAEALSKLPNLRHVGLRDYDGAGRSRDGPQARWRSWGWRYGEPHNSLTHTSPETIFPLLLSALGKAECMPESLQVILRHQRLSPVSFSLPRGQLVKAIVGPLSSLRTLILAISGSDSNMFQGAPWQNYDDENLAEARVRMFLQHTGSLEMLRLNFDSYGGGQFFGERFLDWLGRRTTTPISAPVPTGIAMPPVHLPNLTTLEIGMTNAAGPTLVRLLTKWDLVSFTLRRLTLQCPGPIDQYDCWADFLTKLSTSLSGTNRLRSVRIEEATQAEYTQPHWQGQHVQTTFVPLGTDLEKKVEAIKEPSARYEAKYTGKTVSEWLKDLADRTFVPGIHTKPEVIDLSQSDGEEDEEDEDEDEDEDNEDEEEGSIEED